MVNLGLLTGNRPLKSVKVCFRIPYYTQWGQHLIVCGSEALLGSWNVKKGLLLRPSHQGDELIWSGSVPVPLGFKSEYTYYVVDDERNIVRWEGGKRRKLVLPEGLEEGLSVELRDLWQVWLLLLSSLSLWSMMKGILNLLNFYCRLVLTVFLLEVHLKMSSFVEVRV